MSATPLILGSSSPRRRELLSALGFTFQIARPDIDETPRAGESPLRYVERMCREKAEAICADPSIEATAAVLTADTTVVLGEAIIGKPADAPEAEAMLRSLRGQAHEVYSGVALRNPLTNIIQTQIIRTNVYLRDYSDAEIAAYVLRGEPFDKAGGYAVQDATFRPVVRLEGCAPNVMGLPVCAVCGMLLSAGVRGSFNAFPAAEGCQPHDPTATRCGWRFW